MLGATTVEGEYWLDVGVSTARLAIKEEVSDAAGVTVVLDPLTQ